MSLRLDQNFNRQNWRVPAPDMSARAEISGKSSLVTNVLEAASATQPEETLDESWARLQRSSTAQRVDVSYEQSKIEDKSVAEQTRASPGSAWASN